MVTNWLNRTIELFRSYNTEAGRTALGNLVTTTGCQVIGQGCALVSLWILTHSFSPAQYSTFAAGSVLLAYLTLIGNLSSGAIIVREGAKHPNKIDEITSAFLTLTMLCSMLGTVASIAVVLTLASTIDETIVFVLFAISAVPAALSPAPLYVLHHRQARVAVVIAASESVALGLIAWLYCTDTLTLERIGWVVLAKSATNTTVQFAIYYTSIRQIRLVSPQRFIIRIVSSSLPIMAAALVCFIPLSSGVFLLRGFGSEAEAGLFGLANQIANAFYSIGALGIQILLPHILGPHGIEPSFIRKLSFAAGVHFLGFAVATAVSGILVLEWVLPPDYNGAIGPMLLLILAALFLLIASLAHSYLVRFHEERFILAVHLVVAVCYVGGCIWWIPCTGPTGAAGWAVATTVLAAVICWSRVRALLPRAESS